MSALSVIRRGLIGIAAVALPLVALGAALLSTHAYRDATLYFALLGVAYLAVGGMARTCVRGVGFPPSLAMVLTTLPFGLLVLLAFPVRDGDHGAGFLIALGEGALALLVAWWAARRPATAR